MRKTIVSEFEYYWKENNVLNFQHVYQKSAGAAATHKKTVCIENRKTRIKPFLHFGVEIETWRPISGDPVELRLFSK